jgi:WD40 repeat protein
MQCIATVIKVAQTILTVLVLLAAASVSLAQPDKYPFQRGDEDHISELSWSPENDLILTSSGDENALRLWEVNSGKLLWKTDVGFLQDKLELYSIRHSAWSKDQRLIVTGTDNGKLQLWEAANGKLIWKITAHAGSVTAIAISPDSTTLVSSAELGDWKSELKVWNLADGRLRRNLSANQEAINAIRFIDENRFQTGNGIGRVTTWSTHGFNVIASKQTSPCGTSGGRREAVVYSPDLTLLAAQCRTKLIIADVRTQKIISTVARDENSPPVSFSANNTVLLLPDSEILHIPTATKREFRQFDEGALNHDGSLVAAFPSYRADGVEIFGTRTGERRHWLVGHPGIIKSLAFSADGRLFFCGSADRIVRVWDTETRRVIFSLEGHTDAVESLDVSEDGRTLISRSEKETIVWDVQRGVKLTETREEQRFDEQRKKALSPSGKLALVQDNDKPFRLVDAATDQTIKEFPLIDQLDNLVFCPDEKYFLAKPWWSGWQLWSVDGLKPIREFDLGYSYYNRVAFHPNGRMFITGGSGQNILMFDLQTGNKIWSLFEVDREESASKQAAEFRRVTHLANEKEKARLADIENQPYANKVYITFDHYGDMTPLGEQRIAESDRRNKSLVKKSAADATAIWLRLHNDSPLPISVPTQSMYLSSGNCFHKFSSGEKIVGLCDDREISVWLGLEDRDGKRLFYGLDFGSSVVLLPGKSVLFAVPVEVLKDGRRITFGITFQKPLDAKNVGNYGTEHTLRFGESDLVKP